MKKYLTIVFVLVSFFTYSQLTINAGGYKHLCRIDSISAVLGGTPTATGGTPPYTYAWSIQPIAFGLAGIPYFYAHNFLNDTTLANPTIKSSYGYLTSSKDTITFYLTVTDSIGNIAKDSCLVTQSQFDIHLYQWSWEINLGDSVYLNEYPSVGWGFGATDWGIGNYYTWRPSHGLSDTTLAFGFWSKPDHSVAYTPHVTDIKGCKASMGPTYYVCVKGSSFTEGVPSGVINYCFNTDVNENSANQINLSVFPNPASEILNVECEMMNEKTEIKIIDLLGREMLNEKLEIKNAAAEINVSDLTSGIYFLQVYEKGKLLATQKIIKE